MHCQLLLSERVRNGLSYLLLVFHGLLVGMALSILGLTVAIKSALNNTLKALDIGFSNTCMAYIVTACLLLAIFHGMGVALTWQCRSYAKRKPVISYLFWFFIVWALLASSLFPGLVLTGIETVQMKNGLDKGFKLAMQKYTNDSSTSIQGKDLKMSLAIDEMQKTYKCCGAADYTDWFSTAWISTKGLLKNSKSARR